MKAILYFHGKGGSSDEANYYKKFFPADEVIGIDYKKNTPQETKIEFQNFYDDIAKNFKKIIVIANSIGAYFVMNALAEKKIIPTNFGENLSWEYFCYVKKNQIAWKVPTEILYGEKDNFTTLETMTNFAEKNNFSITIMKDGEHFFHTAEQMQFLDAWFKKFS